MTPEERLYLVRFERIGRGGNPHDVVYNAVDADDLAAQLHRHVGQYLASRGYEVYVDLDAMDGNVFAGAHTVGVFTIEDRGEFRQ